MSPTDEGVAPATDPAVLRRALTGDPLQLERAGTVGRWLLADGGADDDRELQHLVRTTEPRVLYTNAAMLEILPKPTATYDRERPLRTVAIVHAFYDEMTDELLDRLATLPGRFDLVITTSDETKAAAIRETVQRRTGLQVDAWEVRVLPSNRGRDQSAFYVGCRDVLLGDRYDLVVKIHSKRSPQHAHVASVFKRQQFDNLLLDREYSAAVVALFQAEPDLGVVFPPMIHQGFRTMGSGWFKNRAMVEELCERIGISVPLDSGSPLAAYGGMFVARPAALRALAAEAWDWDEYPEESDYGDGTLSHAQERMVAYSAAQAGLLTRCVANAEYAAISHTLLEYKLDRLTAAVAFEGGTDQQVDEAARVAHMGWMVERSRWGLVKFTFGRLFPRATHGFDWVRRRVRR